MVNQAFRIKIAYRSEKEEEKNTRDRSVPDGSDNQKTCNCLLAHHIPARLLLEKNDFVVAP